jgi:uncharacterized membrane protein
MDTPPPATTAPAAEDRTVAIVSYLTLIGFVVAILLHSSKKTQLGAFHLRQALGLFVTGFVNLVLAFIPVIGWILIPVVMIGLLVFLVMGLLGAVQGKMNPVPIVGAYYQKWFAGAFN